MRQFIKESIKILTAALCNSITVTILLTVIYQQHHLVPYVNWFHQLLSALTCNAKATKTYDVLGKDMM